MEYFVQVLSSGVVSGGIYASLALALVLVYQTTGLINFTQGEMAMLSAYVCFALLAVGVPYWIAFALTLALSFCFGALIERFVMRRFYGKNHLVEVIVMMGLFVTFSSVAGAIWTYDINPFPSPFGDEMMNISGFQFRKHDLGAQIVLLVMLAAIFLFFRFTSTGLAMRAAAQNPGSSRLSGINVSLMLTFGWGLAATVGAVSGMMVAPIVFLSPSMMVGPLIYAFAATLLGGVNNPMGAVIGGYLVGIGESMLIAFSPDIGNELKLTLALLLIILILLAKPQGLFGKIVTTRM